MSRNRRQIVDLKCVADASPQALERAAWNYGWFASAALYMDGIAAVTGEAPQRFTLVCVEKEPPFCVVLYPLNADAIGHARATIIRPAVETFATCLRSGEWPGYPDMEMTAPRWIMREAA